MNSLFNWTHRFEGTHWESYRGKDYHSSDLARELTFQFLDTRPKDQPFAVSIAFYPPKAVGTGRGPGEQWSPTNETRDMYNNITIPQPLSMTEEDFSKLPPFLLGRNAATSRFYERFRTPEHFQAAMKNYYALVTGVDQACKEIIDRLKEDGMYNNTMIIFTTDNGMFHGAHGLAGKWYPYQESIRVPLIIRDPRIPKEKVGSLDDSFTLNIDLAETILGAAGIKPDELMQGRDISDLYLPAETDPWREEFFYEFPSPDERGIPSSTALVRKDWKYIHWVKHNREQLFHLENDPLERNDLYDDVNATGVLESMRKRHDELKKELHDPMYQHDSECNKTFVADHGLTEEGLKKD